MLGMRISITLNSGVRYPEFITECAAEVITKEELEDACFEVAETLTTKGIDNFRLTDVDGTTHAFYNRSVAAMSITPVVTD